MTTTTASFSRRAARCAAAFTLAGLALVGAAREARADKPGPMMVNLKIGGSFGLGSLGSSKNFGLDAEFGYSVIGKNGYIVASPQFEFGEATQITIPVGFQYDFEIAKDLYIYPRMQIGFTYVSVAGIGVTAFDLQPAVGIKYLLMNGRINVGLEPFNFPVAIGSTTTETYRFNVYGGVNF